MIRIRISKCHGSGPLILSISNIIIIWPPLILYCSIFNIVWRGVSFTANNCALVYLLDQAGARTTSGTYYTPHFPAGSSFTILTLYLLPSIAHPVNSLTTVFPPEGKLSPQRKEYHFFLHSVFFLSCGFESRSMKHLHLTALPTLCGSGSGRIRTPFCRIRIQGRDVRIRNPDRPFFYINLYNVCKILYFRLL